MRYSNDLDYVRTTTGPIREVIAAVRLIVVGLGLEDARYERKRDSINMKFDAESTDGPGRIRVKIEVDVREVEPCTDHRFPALLAGIGLTG